MSTDQLSAVFAALADPTRRELLLRLMEGDANVSELAAPFDVSQPAISKHLKVLESAGLVSRSRVATSRLSHLEAQPLQEATMWMEKYKHFWNSSFDKLDVALAAYQAAADDVSDSGNEKRIPAMTDIRPDDIAETDVFITRAFDAPRPLVWRFFLEPQHLAGWFAPVGISTPAESISVDPVVGGRWELLMVDDATGDGFPMRGTIVELVEPELLVLRLDAQSGGSPDELMLSIRFHDHGERTRITLHQGPFTPERQHDTESGWLQSFEKLDRQLAARPTPEEAH